MLGHGVGFDVGAPFPPIAQLMAVLPADSAHCLPSACRKLMTDDVSPIIDFYPDALKFALDPNGIPAELRWLWIAKLPFIDPSRLLAAVAAVVPTFTAEERQRNATNGTAELVFAPSSNVGAAATAAAAAAVAHNNSDADGNGVVWATAR